MCDGLASLNPSYGWSSHWCACVVMSWYVDQE